MTAANLYSPWDRLRVGPVWHGWYGSTNGSIYSRLTGNEIILPTGLSFYHPGGGGARICDFGMPPVETTAEERAAGMCWVNKTVFSGPKKHYVCVRGETSVDCYLTETGWLYRCPDGSVYVLSVYQKKVYAKIVDRPRQPQTGSLGSGTMVFDFSNYDTANMGMPSFTNFSVSGKKAAIHMASPLGILEVAVSGGSYTVAPTITQTRWRNLMSTTPGIALNEQTNVVPNGTGWPVGGNMPGNLFYWPFEDDDTGGFAFWGPGVGSALWSCIVGTHEKTSKVIYAVDYRGETPIDLGWAEQNTWVFSASFGQDDQSDYYTQWQDVSCVATFTEYIFAGDAVSDRAYRKKITRTFPTRRFYRGKSVETPYYSDAGGETSVSVSRYLANGQTMVYSTTAPQFDWSGNSLFNSCQIYGYAGASGCAGDVNTNLGASNWGSFSIDPFTGIFTPGRGPYF